MLNYRSSGLKFTVLFVALLTFTNISFAQTPLEVILGQNNVPITEVQFTHDGTTITQTAGVSSNTATNKAAELNYIEINGDTKLYLNDFGNVVNNNNFTSVVQGVGIHKTGDLSSANDASVFEPLLDETINNVDLMQFIYYDAASNVPSAADFDIAFAKGITSTDYVAVGERNGNTHFTITPLDEFGNVLTNAETIIFGNTAGTNSGNGTTKYDWDIGFSPMNQSGQSMVYTVISADLFSAGSNVIFGFRIDNNGDADVKFFGLSEDGFAEHPTNSQIGGLSGNVFHDSDGLVDATVDGAPISTPDGVVLYANLYDNATGLVIASVPINSDGSYEFLDLEPGSTYAVSISTNEGVAEVAVPAQDLPTDWMYTGDNTSDLPGDDGNSDGMQTGLTVVEELVTEVNFGIQEAPVADPYFFNIDAPAPNSTFVIGSDVTADLSGEDNEDGNLGSTSTFGITSLPTSNNNILYDGLIITVGQDGINPPSPSNPFVIENYDPSLLEIEFSGDSDQSSTSFDYVSIDEAGIASPPVTYALNFASLPVEWLSFDVRLSNESAIVEFSTATEINNSHFLVQKSMDGIQFSDIETIEGAVNSVTVNQYSFTDRNVEDGTNYYRVMQVDLNGRSALTEVKAIDFEEQSQIVAFPNPVSSHNPFINLKNIPTDGVSNISIYNINGQLVKNIAADGNSRSNVQTVELANLQAGLYILRVGDSQEPILFNISE